MQDAKSKINFFAWVKVGLERVILVLGEEHFFLLMKLVIDQKCDRMLRTNNLKGSLLLQQSLSQQTIIPIFFHDGQLTLVKFLV